MVSEQESMEILRDTIDADTRIPDRMEYVLHEADADGAQANVSLPFIEIQLVTSSRDDLANSNLYGFVEDDQGNRVGRIYETKWEAQVQIDVWTADGSDYDANELGETVYTVLYDYDSRGPAKSFTDENGEPVETLWDFQLQEGSRQDDLGQTPTVRRWRQQAQLRGAQRYRTTGETPTKGVNLNTS